MERIIKVVLVFAIVITAQDRVQVLREMKSLGFSEKVVLAAVEGEISYATISTLRKLQKGEFSDGVYLEVIRRKGVYNEYQIQQLLSLKIEGYGESLIIAALPRENAGYQAERQAAAADMNKAPVPDVQPQLRLSSGVRSAYPNGRFDSQLMVLTGTSIEGLDEDVPGGGGIFGSFMMEQSPKVTYNVRYGWFTMRYGEIDWSYMYMGIDMMSITASAMYNIRSGVREDGSPRGLSLSAGPIIVDNLTFMDLQTNDDSYSMDMSSSGTAVAFGICAAAEIPIIPGRIYVSGYFEAYSQTMTMETSMTTEVNGYYSFDDYSEDVESTYSNYMFDLILYPLADRPDLRISLGQALQGTGEEDALEMLTIGVSYSWGPYYKSRKLLFDRK